MRTNTDPSASVVVFPEGITLNFLFERENPTQYYVLLPPDFVRPDFETNIINALEDNSVEYVIIVNRFTSEYGLARFGIDYAKGIRQYVEKHYAMEKQFGPLPFTTKEISFLLFRRRQI